MTLRAVQLDGMRGLAMVAICWDHWTPTGWPRLFPFEVFLFFFLVLTGYLITGTLLRERERSEATGGPWRARAYLRYQMRRSLRILAPYYAALLLCLLVGASDVRDGFWWYASQLSNWHIAALGFWPAGSNHFWSLAIQQQFYLLWPLVIWWTPHRWLPLAITWMIATGPLSRFHHDAIQHWVAWPQLLTWASLDYFGIGALLAWLVWRNYLTLSSRWLRGVSVVGLMIYLSLFNAKQLGFSPDGWKFLQQTSLAVALCGLIAMASSGSKSPWGKLLECPPLQRLGQYSYGLYLFHNPAPLLAGKLFWFLWLPIIPYPLGICLQLFAFAGTAWLLTLASWHWIEQPLAAIRARQQSV